MDIGHGKLVILAAFAGGFCALSGCSESRGYVDYTSIPGPSATVSDTEVVAADQQPPPSSSATESASPSTEPSEAKSSDASSNSSPSPEASTPPTDTAASSVESPEAATSVTEKADDTGTVVPAISKVEATMNSAGSDVVPASASNSTEVPSGDAAAVANYDGVTASEPREIRLLVPEKRFRPEGDQQALRVSYDDIDLLKVLNMEPVPVDADQHFPDWLTQLDGQRIRIRGFMYPTFEATGLTAFTLARDNGICCFVREPKIYDIIAIKLAKGQTSDYIDNKPFDVEGTFRIVPEADEEELYQLYSIEDATVVK